MLPRLSCVLIITWICAALVPCRAATGGATEAGEGGNRRETYDLSPRRGPHHRWEETVTAIKSPQGTMLVTNRHARLELGLHYSRDGRWLDTVEEVRIDESGLAVADQGPLKAVFRHNPNVLGAIEVTGPDGQRLLSNPLGLRYLDRASGKAVYIAEVQDCQGVLLPPNRVLYPDAFTGVLADIRYTYRKGSFEQDVVLREAPAPPSAYGLDDATTVLEVWTEFIQAPPPRSEVSVAIRESDVAGRLRMAHPDILDEQLDFGAVHMGSGKGFVLADGGEMPEGEPVPVYKRWRVVQDRQFLVETVEFRLAEPGLLRLPKRQAAVDRRSPVLLAEFIATLPVRVAAPAAQSPPRWAAVAGPERPAFVIDYQELVSANNFTFQSGTYGVYGEVVLTGTTTISPNAVVKFAAGASVRVSGGTLVCPASGTAYFVHQYDPVGEPLDERFTPLDYRGNPMLHLDGVASATIRNLEFREATKAVRDASGTGSHLLTDCTFRDCVTALESYATAGTMQNVSVCRTTTLYANAGGTPWSVPGSTTPVCDADGTLHVSATSIALPSAGYHDFTYPGDVDTMVLSVPSAGTLAVWTTGTADTYGAVKDASGNVVAYDNNNGQVPNFSLSCAVNPGTYYVSVRPVSYSGLVGYTLNTSFNPSAPPGDPGGSIATASPVAFNSSYSGAIDVAGDEDFFRLDLASAANLSVYTTGSTDTYGYLLDPSGNILTSNDDNPYPNFAISHVASAGTYYIRVRHYSSGGTGTYTLLVTGSGSSDSDADGLPDLWEQEYFGTLSQGPGGDFDSDGLTNLAEYQSGTNPVVPNNTSYSEIAKSGMTADASTTYADWVPANAINGTLSDPGWHNSGTLPTGSDWLRVNLGSSLSVARVQYVPRVDVGNGTYLEYAIYVTDNPSTDYTYWGAAAATGSWSWANGREVKTVDFTPRSGRYVVFRCLVGNGAPWYASAGEIWIYSQNGNGDSDSDGLPDTWELAHFGHLGETGTGDYDYDGSSNSAEYQAGTPPEIPAGTAYTEVPKGTISADASTVYENWVPANTIDASTSDPGWHNIDGRPVGQDWLRLNLGSSKSIGRVQYLPREDVWNGTFIDYAIYVTDSPSSDMNAWGAPVASGTWTWAAGRETKTLTFPARLGRYVVFRCLRGRGAERFASAGEVWAYNTSLGGATDSDGDGLGDAWEIAQFANLAANASGDPDGDGLTNYQELAGATNPRIPDPGPPVGGPNLQPFSPAR
jgi:hypothetical protein